MRPTRRPEAPPTGGSPRTGPPRRAGRGRHAASQEPEAVPAAPLDRVAGPAIVRFQPVVGQVGCEANTSWQAPVLQHDAATPYHVVVGWRTSRNAAPSVTALLKLQ